MASAPGSAPYHPLHVGLAPLPLEAWLAPRPGDEALRAQRRHLLATQRDEVLAALPEAASAVAELAGTLRTRGLTLPETNDARAQLAALGASLAEDICLLLPAEQSYRLAAAVLCFPNRWRLKDKVGRSMLDTHGPVPDYAEHLARGVDHFLTRLKPERAFTRSNWGVSSSPALFLQAPTPPVNMAADITFFLRREEQSFRKLPESGAVVFAIRTHVTPWAEVPAEVRSAIGAAAAELGPAWRGYKSLT